MEPIFCFFVYLAVRTGLVQYLLKGNFDAVGKPYGSAVRVPLFFQNMTHDRIVFIGIDADGVDILFLGKVFYFPEHGLSKTLPFLCIVDGHAMDDNIGIVVEPLALQGGIGWFTGHVDGTVADDVSFLFEDIAYLTGYIFVDILIVRVAILPLIDTGGL